MRRPIHVTAQVRTLVRRLDDWTLYAFNAQPYSAQARVRHRTR
jgi:hypothetical protein